MIPRTFHDGNPEDRAYVQDYWAWLQHQSQDAWLLWARCANWDNADTIFEAMVDRPECDLAVVGWIFWGTQPGYYVSNPGSYRPDTLIGRIVAHVEEGYYHSQELHLSRYECAIQAHEYCHALATSGGVAPFRLPRALCGPFEGRRASIPRRFSTDVEAELQVIFSALDGGLPRSEDEYWRDQRNGGNLWIADHLKLPRLTADPIRAGHGLDDLAYVEMIFGPGRDYTAARAAASGVRPKTRWWPF